MAFMVWNDRLMTGIAAIDSDHRRLLGIVNDLYEAIQEGQSHEQVTELMRMLTDYTRVHFAREERFFATTHYAGAAEHKAEHDGMVRWVAQIQAQVENGTAVAPSLEVMNYLKDWLFDHILGSDQRYVRHLTAAGVR